jgi:hypothetical protein
MADHHRAHLYERKQRVKQTNEILIALSDSHRKVSDKKSRHSQLNICSRAELKRFSFNDDGESFSEVKQSANVFFARVTSQVGIKTRCFILVFGDK